MLLEKKRFITNYMEIWFEREKVLNLELIQLGITGVTEKKRYGALGLRKFLCKCRILIMRMFWLMFLLKRW
jgi:hypothetical protein